jgi:putative transposase
MPRMARLVVPGYPHHVTQRGNRRQKTFFRADDYRAYLDLLADEKDKAGVEVWAYCLMPNHVHLIVVPSRSESLASLFRAAHRRYTCRINLRHAWRGHLWQERFHSSVMDEKHLMAAVRYTEMNPVHAGLCARPEDWRWSSVSAHLDAQDDALVTVRPMLDRVGDWSTYLQLDARSSELDSIRKNAKSGRPSGETAFIRHLEDLTGRRLRLNKPGPKRVK